MFPYKSDQMFQGNKVFQNQKWLSHSVSESVTFWAVCWQLKIPGNKLALKDKLTINTKIKKDQKEFDIVVVYQKNRHHHHRHNDHHIGQSVYDILLRMREGDFDIDYEEIRKVTT